MPDRRFAVVACALVSLPVVLYAVAALLPVADAFVVVSDSMGTTVPAGSLVFVVATGDYSPGDVVSFTRGDVVVTHRIVDQDASGYRTKGDANAALDEWRVPASAIVGERVLVVPWYGRIVGFAGSTLGWVLFVLLPGVGLAATELRRLRSALR